MKTSKKESFLPELSNLSKKYQILIESTDILFLTDDSGDIGEITYNPQLEKYQ